VRALLDAAGRVRARLRPRTRWRLWSALVRELGAREAARFWWHRLGGRRGGGTVRALRTPLAAHPLWVRGGTSDPDVFQQIFVEREYACLDSLAGVETVIDCGANVGYSSAWFLSRWPRARLLAVEPDEANFRALGANLAPYGARAALLRAGVWSHSCGLKMEEREYRGGGTWARQVRESRPGEAPDLQAVSVPDLFARLGAGRVSLLKIDIEGAEAVVFGADCEWVERVDVLVAELHDDSHFGSGVAAFERAVLGRGFQVELRGELTIARRPGALTS